MERFVKGDIVVIPFPFSDLSSFKKRPALVVAQPFDGDILLAQITSQKNNNKYYLEIDKQDFDSGFLPVKSFVRINKLFSADQNIIIYKSGNLKSKKIFDIEKILVNYIKK